jgi:hypothetical protein
LNIGFNYFEGRLNLVGANKGVAITAHNAVTANTSGSALDFRQYQGAKVHVIVSGAGSFDIQVQTAPTSGGTYVTDTDNTTTAITASTTFTLHNLNSYVKLNIVNYSGSATISVYVTPVISTAMGGGAGSDVNVTNSTLAVTQSGSWSVGRTWSLASGTDSVTAVQSGTWAQNLTQVGGAAVSLGQKTAANSIPVVLPSDQGTIPIQGGAFLPATGSASANGADVIASTDISQAGAITLQITGTFVGTITFQASNDNTTFVSVAAFNIAASAAAVTTATAPGVFLVQSGYRYFRARFTAYTSGTATGTLVGNRMPTPSFFSGGSTAVTGTVAATQSGTWNITNVSGTVSLPTGAATAAKQPALGTAGTPSADVISVQGRAGMTALTVDGSAVTQPVSIAGTVAISAASLPLPTGAATETTLASILTNTPAPGQTTMAGSSPVVIASNQTAIPVSQNGTWTVARSWTMSSGTDSVSAIQSGTWNITNISGTVSLPTGAATSAKQPALGTAGTASADVITVQGVAGMTALKVDGSATTQPVSGTFWQATQPVSIAGTVAISAASLPLPTGAATAAKQPALGTAGTPSADVITVQGAASMTALVVDGSAVTQPVSGTINAVQSGAWSAGRTWSLSSGTDSVAATQSGTWNITNISGTISLPTGAATQSTLASILANTPAPGQTTMAASSPVVIASNQTAIPAAQSGTWNITNISGTVSLPTGAATETTLSAINNKLNETTVNGAAATVTADAQATAARTFRRLGGRLTNTNNGTAQPIQIGVEGGAAANTYTVTAAKELVISSLVFGAYGVANSDTNFFLEMGINNVWSVVLQGVVGRNSRPPFGLAVTFPEPMRIPAGVDVGFRVTQNATAAGLYSISTPDSYEVTA